jgi:hypothetical protein
MPSSRLVWANFPGSARRRSAIIARSSISPSSVKNSRGAARIGIEPHQPTVQEARRRRRKLRSPSLRTAAPGLELEALSAHGAKWYLGHYGEAVASDCCPMTETRRHKQSSSRCWPLFRRTNSGTRLLEPPVGVWLCIIDRAGNPPARKATWRRNVALYKNAVPQRQ